MNGGFLVTLGLDEENRPFFEVNGRRGYLHPLVWWQLEQQMAEGSSYWLRGKTLHLNHSELLDATGNRRVKRGT